MPEPRDERIRLRLNIRGRVQGVGFRYFTRSAARKLGLPGWVRNEPDGSVQCEVQGPSDLVEQLLSVLRRGPSSGRVDDVRIEPLAVAEPECETFEIR